MLNAKSYFKFSANLLFLGTIVSTSQAQAQLVNIPINGNLPGSCTFGAINGGTLVKHPSLPAVTATGGGVSVGGQSAGTAGSVTVNCQNSSALTISPPIGLGPSGFTPSAVQALVQKGNSTALLDMASANMGGTFEAVGPWNTTNPTMQLQTGSTVLNISLAAGSGQNNLLAPFLPTGNYTYTINLSITGN